MRRPIHTALSQDEVERLLAATDVAEQRRTFLRAAYAGLRSGEVRALRWNDVDFRTRTLTVRLSSYRGEISTPKSGHERSVPLAEVLFAELSTTPKNERDPELLVCRTSKGEEWGPRAATPSLRRSPVPPMRRGPSHEQVEAVPELRGGLAHVLTRRARRRDTLRSPTMKVTLILDPAYGERLERLDLPVWVRESPGNRLAAERRWATPRFDPKSVTVFKTVGASHDETCADIIPTIDEHHPEWTEITVIGAVVTPAMRAYFAQFEPGDFLESEAGFTYFRSAST